MELHQPIMITARLLPGVKIGEGTISIEYDSHKPSGRICYRYYIDLPNFEYVNDNLKSGCQGGNLQEGLSRLLSFLSAAAESYDYKQETGYLYPEGIDIEKWFPIEICKWASQNSDELSMLSCDLKELTDLIVE